jgi:hypothetical protein
MALGRKTGGRNFQKGQTTKPNGRPKLPPDLQGLKTKFSGDMVEKTFIKYMMMSVDDMAKVGQDKSLPALDHVIMMIIRKAGLDGDQQRLDFLLNRTIGKVVDKTENTDYRVNINAQLDTIPKEKLISLLKDAEEPTFVDVTPENE